MTEEYRNYKDYQPHGHLVEDILDARNEVIKYTASNPDVLIVNEYTAIVLSREVAQRLGRIHIDELMEIRGMKIVRKLERPNSFDNEIDFSFGVLPKIGH